MRTLAIDIGGTGIKAAVLDDAGAMLGERHRVPTPKRPITPDPTQPNLMTTFVFRVRNVPAALYKALGGFATNGVNMTKLESYQLEGSFAATQFYADIEGHPGERRVALALEELAFFTSTLKVLGTYPAHPFRKSLKAG